ncbi:MAG: MarC family protein [bacterium]
MRQNFYRKIRGRYNVKKCSRVINKNRRRNMRMSVFTVFWGVFFILLGFTMILKAFGIDIPFFRIVMAVLLIFVGIKMLVPGSWPGKSIGRTTMFAESEIKGSNIDGE